MRTTFKVLIFSGLVMFLAVAAYVISRRITTDVLLVRAQSRLVPFRAERWVYSYERVEGGKIVLQPSPGVVVLKEVVYGDSHGSLTTVSSSLRNPDRFVGRLIENTSGYYASVVDEARVVSSHRVDDAALLNRRALAAVSGCVIPNRNQITLGGESIQGIDTVIVQQKLPNARITEWLAPSLGCFALARKSEKQQPEGNLATVSEYRTISLSLEVPDPAVFQVPSDYKEVPPSELDARLKAIEGATFSPEQQRRLDRQREHLDQLYFGQKRFR